MSLYDYVAGSLVFSHVTLDDEQGERVYKCYAYNSIRRKGIYGSYHRIKVKGEKSML